MCNRFSPLVRCIFFFFRETARRRGLCPSVCVQDATDALSALPSDPLDLALNKDAKASRELV